MNATAEARSAQVAPASAALPLQGLPARIQAGLLLAIEHAPAEARAAVRTTIDSYVAQGMRMHAALRTLQVCALRADPDAQSEVVPSLRMLSYTLANRNEGEAAPVDAHELAALLHEAADDLEGHEITLKCLFDAASKVIALEAQA